MAATGVPLERHGVAAGLIGTAAQLGTAFGLAVLVGVASAQLASHGLPEVDSRGAQVEGYRWALRGVAAFALLGWLLAFWRLPHTQRA